MRILMLVNWKIKYLKQKPIDDQPMNYLIEGEPYWFFKFFDSIPNVDVIDTHSFKWLENFEKYKIRFYLLQAFKAIPKLNSYDVIISHGMQSGIVLALFRRFFPSKSKHIVFDIGTFNSAAENGKAMKLMQFASKSIDGIIYHSSWQKFYYERKYPWIVSKSIFIPLGIDTEILQINFSNDTPNIIEDYILCIGQDRCDWNTVIQAYKKVDTKLKLRFIGGIDKKYEKEKGIEMIPRISFDTLLKQIRNASFCILPIENVKYSFGQIRLLQQMAMGKCVIIPETISLVDYGINRETVLFYKPKNIISCAKVMQKIIDDKELKKMIEKRAADTISKKYTEKIMAKQIEKYLHNLN